MKEFLFRSFPTGYTAELNKASTLLYNLTDTSIEACNWTYYGDWAYATGFNQSAYLEAFDSISTTNLFWTLMENDTELSTYLGRGPLHSNLSRYYATIDVARDRCANPEIFKGTWDMSSTFACPTIYTFPHFLAASQDVSNSTGSQQWAPNALRHGYSLSVDPLTGVSIGGHKTYQINHLVSQTAVLYAHLWVSPNSSTMLPSASPTKDFVTVPTFWVAMTWEPTNSVTNVIGTISRLNDALYYLLVAGCPVLGWVLLGPALFFLRFGKLARQRALLLPRIQRSQKDKASTGHGSGTPITINVSEDGANGAAHVVNVNVNVSVGGAKAQEGEDQAEVMENSNGVRAHANSRSPLSREVMFDAQHFDVQ